MKTYDTRTNGDTIALDLFLRNNSKKNTGVPGDLNTRIDHVTTFVSETIPFGLVYASNN